MPRSQTRSTVPTSARRSLVRHQLLGTFFTESPFDRCTSQDVLPTGHTCLEISPCAEKRDRVLERTSKSNVKFPFKALRTDPVIRQRPSVWCYLGQMINTALPVPLTRLRIKDLAPSNTQIGRNTCAKKLGAQNTCVSGDIVFLRSVTFNRRRIPTRIGWTQPTPRTFGEGSNRRHVGNLPVD